MSMTWNTPDDVLNDLARVTGVTGFDRSHLIRGQKPPPTWTDYNEEDDEIIQRFGNVKEPLPDRYSPDFRGITEMLRMVNEHDAPTKCKENLDSLDIKPTKVIVSKLNPNVHEFVPNSISTQKEQAKDKDKGKGDNPTISGAQGKENMNRSNEVQNGTKNPYTHVNKPKQASIAALKEKIIETAKANNLKEKKERNVAIATLLRLNCRGSPSVEDVPVSLKKDKTNKEASITLKNEDTSNVSQASGPSKLVLLTPDYYKGHISAPVPSASKKPEEAENVALEYDAETGIPSRSLILIDYSEFQEAAEKVNGWFEKLEKDIISEPAKDVVEKKTVSPEPKKIVETPTNKKEELGPPRSAIIFKPKTAPCSSVAHSNSSSPSITPRPTGPRSFVPSERTKELAKMYAEKKEKSEAQAKQKMGLWEKVECELKERDEIIKNRKNNESSPTSSTSSGSKKRIFP